MAKWVSFDIKKI